MKTTTIVRNCLWEQSRDERALHYALLAVDLGEGDPGYTGAEDL